LICLTRNGVGQRLAVGWGVGNVLALTPTQKQSPADTRQEANGKYLR